MRRMLWCGLVVFGLLAGMPAAHAGEKPAADEPTVVIRIKSLDTVLQNLKLLATLVNREQAALDIQALIKAKVGDKGLQGIDLTRPVGAYVKFGQELDDLNGAILIPVADEKAFITLLENLEMKPAKGKDGIYTLQTKQNIELYMRFAKKYAYVSAINTENLSDKNLLDPAKVLAGSDDSLVSATVRLDQVPEAAKLLLMAQIEQDLQTLQDSIPIKETEAQKAFRKATLRQVSETISTVLKDGQRARIDVKMEGKELALSATLTAKPGSELAKTITSAGKNKSAFAGLMIKNAAVRASVDTMFPEKVHKAFSKVVEEGVKKALEDITTDAKRKQAQDLIDSFLPTVHAGQLDAFFGMTGPTNNHYTLLAAVKLKDGDKFGAVVRDLVGAELKKLTPEQQKKIQLDVDSVGSVKIHRFELPREDKAGKLLDDLPGDPNLYVAFRKDAVFVAIGPASLATIKEAIAMEQTGATPMLSLDVNFARLASTLAQTPDQKKIAKQFAGKNGQVRLSVEGGESMTLQARVALDLLELLAKMNESKGQE